MHRLPQEENVPFRFENRMQVVANVQVTTSFIGGLAGPVVQKDRALALIYRQAYAAQVLLPEP